MGKSPPKLEGLFESVKMKDVFLRSHLQLSIDPSILRIAFLCCLPKR